MSPLPTKCLMTVLTTPPRARDLNLNKQRTHHISRRSPLHSKTPWTISNWQIQLVPLDHTKNLQQLLTACLTRRRRYACNSQVKKRITKKLIMDRMIMNKISLERILSRMLIHQAKCSPILSPVLLNQHLKRKSSQRILRQRQLQQLRPLKKPHLNEKKL